MFAAYLLRHYHAQGALVVYEDAKRKSRWLLHPGAPVQKGSLTDFDDHLDQAATVYICDVGGRGSPEPTVCAALTIVLSSPDAAHYHEWLKLKDKPTVHMPSWTADEVTAVVPSIYPQRFLADGVTSIYPGRFELYGGCARTIFSPNDDAHLEHKLASTIQTCDLDLLLASISTGTRLGPLQQLVAFTLATLPDGSPDFRSASMGFASDAICERVMQEKEKQTGNQIVSFLLTSVGKADVASMRGKAFEYWAHRVLAAGGTFRARWESDNTHADVMVNIPPSTQKGVVGDLTTLAAGVSTRTAQHCTRCALCVHKHVLTGLRIACMYCCCCCWLGVRSFGEEQLQDDRRCPVPEAPVPDDGVHHALGQPGWSQCSHDSTRAHRSRQARTAVPAVLRRATRHLPRVPASALLHGAASQCAASQRQPAGHGDASAAHVQRRRGSTFVRGSSSICTPSSSSSRLVHGRQAEAQGGGCRCAPPTCQACSCCHMQLLKKWLQDGPV